jgi:hypothetical protein
VVTTSFGELTLRFIQFYFLFIVYCEWLFLQLFFKDLVGCTKCLLQLETKSAWRCEVCLRLRNCCENKTKVRIDIISNLFFWENKGESHVDYFDVCYDIKKIVLHIPCKIFVMIVLVLLLLLLTLLLLCSLSVTFFSTYNNSKAYKLQLF